MTEKQLEKESIDFLETARNIWEIPFTEKNDNIIKDMYVDIAKSVRRDCVSELKECVDELKTIYANSRTDEEYKKACEVLDTLLYFVEPVNGDEFVSNY